MLEILQFLLGDFWVFLGSIFLIYALGSAVAEIIAAIRRK